MPPIFGQSDIADQFRWLHFSLLEARGGGHQLESQAFCLRLQDFLQQEEGRNAADARYVRPVVANYGRMLRQMHDQPDVAGKRTELCAAVTSKLKAAAPAPLPPQAGIKSRLSEDPLLAGLLSEDLENRLKIAFEQSETSIGLRSTDGEAKAKARWGTSPKAGPDPRTALQSNVQQEDTRNDTQLEADAASRWKRKRPEVAAQEKDFYTCSPEDCESPTKLQAKGKGKSKTRNRPAADHAPSNPIGHPSDGGFATAKAVLVAEQQASSTRRQASLNDYHIPEPVCPDAQSGFHSKDHAGKRPMISGLRRTQPPQAGARGAFVPPFVKKAMQDPKEEQATGPLSAKTLELLGGPEGELPEALQKLDPNILELVCNEILDTRASVSWDDIAGQDDAKGLVQELVVWPMLNPHLFTGARAPPKGLLLFGPPGTGKTLIGRAIASNIKATFFNISASSLTSKWIGEGEKMVRALFAVAHALQPAVIFMDEIDSVLSARKAEGEHEASRRLKTELLVQMEGVDPSGLASRILLVGATNRPEELDEAARRRMPKQMYIPLPCEAARESMLLRQLGTNCSVRADLPQSDIAKIVARTKGYSGSDMRNLIQEASQGPVRDAVKQHGAGIAGLAEADLRPVVLKDFQVAARAQRASVEPAEIVRYEEYNSRHGARYAQRQDDCADDDW